jgi:hypothetical protein
MKDLTIIFLTVNETPEEFAKYQMDTLLKAIGDTPLITVSRKPMKVGHNILDTYERTYINIYRQMLIAAREAKTPYVAIAEDDVLYSKEHFSFYRPALDTFAYDRSRWSLYLWKPELFSLKQRRSNCTLIAPRELLVKALEERFEKYPDQKSYLPNKEKFIGEVGRNNYERHLGLTQWKNEDVYCPVPCIHINHPAGNDFKMNNTRKRIGEIQAYDIPHWGKAIDISKLYK